MGSSASTNPTEVDSWLNSIGYGKYSSSFGEKGYDKKISLIALKEEDLEKKFGVLEGHKYDLYIQIQKLKKDLGEGEKVSNQFEEEKVIEINLLVVGAGGTGKSALTTYYKETSYNPNIDMTTIIENRDFQTMIRKRAVIGQFCDCPGQTVYWNKLKELGIRKTFAIVGVCSIDQEKSGDLLDSEYLSAARANNVDCHMAIICNKMDLKNNIAYSKSYEKVLKQIERINITKRNNFKTYYVSASKGDNVLKAFDEIIEDTVTNYLTNKGQ